MSEFDDRPSNVWNKLITATPTPLPCEECGGSGLLYKRKIVDKTAYAFRCGCRASEKRSFDIPLWSDAMKQNYF